MVSPSSSEAKRRSSRGIVVGGALAGVFDITYACVLLHFRGRSPLWTFQSVASGLLGSAAFERGLAAGILGGVAHFTIALGASVTFWAAARRIGLLRRRPVLSGLLFGVGVYLFMNFVVLPLSAYPFELRFPPRALARGFLSHALLVGLPIALAQARGGGSPPAHPARPRRAIR